MKYNSPLSEIKFGRALCQGKNGMSPTKNYLKHNAGTAQGRGIWFQQKSVEYMNLTLLQSLTEHISLEIYCLKCWYPVCFCTGTDSPVMGHGPVRVRVGV